MKVLVVYFSASGKTKKVAEKIAEELNSDIYEIKPEVAYSKADLNWMNPRSRSSVEMKDKKFRPKLDISHIDITEYDIIYLGFPIWWYVAPTIVNTFLESYDFSNKKIVLFATSGSSGFGNTIEELKVSVDSSTSIEEGKVFKGIISLETVKKWIYSVK